MNDNRGRLDGDTSAIKDRLGNICQLSDTHAITVSDNNGNLLYANEKYLDLSGFSLEDLTGKPYMITCTYGHGAAFFDNIARILASGKIWRGEIQSRHKNGSFYWLDATIIPNEHLGNLSGFTAIATDISQYKNAAQILWVESEYRKSQLESVHAMLKASRKIHSIGAMAAGLAHEINNPMCFIAADFHYLKDGCRKVREVLYNYIMAQGQSVNPTLLDTLKTSRIHEFLNETDDVFNEIENGIERIAQVTSDLKSFCVEDDHHKTEIRVADCIRHAIRLVSPELPENACILDSIEEAPTIIGNSASLCQALVNILTNAIHAIGENGTILVASTTENNDTVLLSIRDTGHGIEEIYLERIFEPFFTTNSSSSLGLGLTFCADIIENHGGSIECHSQIGRGSEFQIRLPRANAAPVNTDNFVI